MRLREEQEHTSQQATKILATQADDTQKRIQSVKRVAIKMQQEVLTLSALACMADLTAKTATKKVERQVAIVQQQMKEQQMLLAKKKEAEVAKVAQATTTKQLEDAQKIVQATTSMPQRYEE